MFVALYCKIRTRISTRVQFSISRQLTQLGGYNDFNCLLSCYVSTVDTHCWVPSLSSTGALVHVHSRVSARQTGAQQATLIVSFRSPIGNVHQRDAE